MVNDLEGISRGVIEILSRHLTEKNDKRFRIAIDLERTRTSDLLVVMP